VALRPCGLVEAGVIHAAGERTVDREVVTAPWGAGGVGLNLHLTPTRPLDLVLEGSAVFPWGRDRFFFDPDEPENTAFEVAPVGLSGRFSLVMRLW
jgi:hypothetical protein